MKSEILDAKTKRDNLEFYLPSSAYILHSRDIPPSKIPELIQLFQPYFEGNISEHHFTDSIFVFEPENSKDKEFISKINSIISNDSIKVITDSKYEISLLKGDYILTLRSKGEPITDLKDNLSNFLNQLGE